MQSQPYLFYDKTGSGMTNGAPRSSNDPAAGVANSSPQSVGNMASLHFALGNLKAPELEALLQQNPEAVHEKGFNGQSPLHKAVLSCDVTIVDLLLRYKADPRATNSYDETPLHFACKRGSPQIIKTLVDHGADVTSVDKAGKGPIHHSAHGGGVHGLHYLTEGLGLSTHIRDLNLSTPLHVVAAHGHQEALKYLLRKDRCDVLAQNAHANNALHLAANAGHGWTCWKILEHGGLELLHQENREGKTPLDLARSKHKDPMFRETLMLLSYYSRIRQRSGSADGPVLAWYFHGLFPFLAYPVILAIAGLTSRPGTVTLAGFIILLLILYKHTHRMNHVSRWPNPLYFGMFLAGMLHTSAYFYIEMLPYIYEQYPSRLYLMIFWNLVFFYTYYKLLTTDPGRAEEPAQKPGSLWRYSIKDVADGSVRMEAFCTNCELIPPRLTHHCKLCLGCYLNTDHHCLFLYRCIAKNNHRLFIAFCALVVVGILLFLAAMLDYFRFLYAGRDVTTELLKEIYESRPWTWTVFVANLVSAFWGCNLVRFQLNVVSKAQTTVYQPSGGLTMLTTQQRLYNIVYFLAGRGYYATEETLNV